jgi:hypothetical protein
MKNLTTAEQATRAAAINFAHVLEGYIDWIPEDEDAIDKTSSCREENQAYYNLEATIDNAVKDLLTAYKKYKESEKEREELYNELFGEEDEEE